jgi:D-psicose/D-tagatose/L-ribulose 3-epimerase
VVKTVIHAAVWSSDPDPARFSRVLAEAAEIGFDGVALPLRDVSAILPGALERAYRDAAMTALGTVGLPADGDISSADAGARKRGEAHLHTVVHLARDIGMVQINGAFFGLIGQSSGPVHGDRRKYSAEVLHRTAEIADRAGVRLGVEILNRYETSLLNSVEQGIAYLAAVDHANVSLHIDTYHTAIEENDPVGAIHKALPYLGYFELDQSHRGDLDKGSLDLRAMAAPVAASAYQGFVGVEAFARSRMSVQHANALSIWRDHFEDGTRLARNAMTILTEIFGKKRDMALS